MQAIVKKPFQFNPLKHHLQYIKEFCLFYKKQNDFEQLKESLKTIGHSITDIYTGSLTVVNITDEIEFYLSDSRIIDKDRFYCFINGLEKKFINIKISDDSSWTLTLSKEDECYVHLHPARNSINLIRTSCNALKTAIIMEIFLEENSKTDLEKLNLYRYNYCSLSPLKMIDDNSRCIWLFKMLQQHK